MWYKIDLSKLVVQLLPPILRSKFLAALLHVLTMPLRSLYGRFCELKEDVDNHLNTTGNVQYLEKALNDAFYLKARQIYIETPEEDNVPAFYFASENQAGNILFAEEEEEGFILRYRGESNVQLNFIVKVPTFLCTSLEDAQQDKYGWDYLTTIRNILKIYKPAGRTFGIELYDYE